MMLLVRREQELLDEKTQLKIDLPRWVDRVELAEKKGMDELAGEGRVRLESLRTRWKEVRHELEQIEERKHALRLEKRRPDGAEARRAEQILQNFREAGIDVDEAQLEAEFAELARGGQVDEDVALAFEEEVEDSSGAPEAGEE
jgi:hypothetical protein